jgi:hypothetical protein
MARTHMAQKKHRFSCPVSTHIAWEWGLVYKECPVSAGERDMDECRSCPLRGNAIVAHAGGKPRPRKDDRDGDRSRKQGRRPVRKEHKEQQK